MKEIKIKGVNEVIYEHTAASGLKVYIWPYTLSEEIDLSLTVKYGSIHTDFKVGTKSYHLPNGIAHFLEHIKFNEKKDETAHDYFYKMGSYTNAYTTYDHTSYEVTCTKDLKDNLNHLLYFVFNPYFTKALVEKEKGIIVEESKMTLDDPYTVGYQSLLQNLFKYNKKRNLVTGEEDDINSITMEDALAVFDNFYHPENMFLTVTGNVNPYEVVKIVDKYFEKNKYDKYVKPKIINKREPDETVKKSSEINANVTKEKLFLGFKIPKVKFKSINDLKLRVLFNIILTINFGFTSELNEYLLQNDLIDDLYYNLQLDDKQIVIIFEISSSYPKEVIKRVKEKMTKLECSDKEFTRKNKSLIAGTILGYEDANDVNSDIRADIVHYDKINNNIQDVFKKLSFKDGQNIISKLDNYDTTYVILKPNEENS